MQISTINLEAKYAQPRRKINKRPETESQAKSWGGKLQKAK